MKTEELIYRTRDEVSKLSRVEQLEYTLSSIKGQVIFIIGVEDEPISTNAAKVILDLLERV